MGDYEACCYWNAHLMVKYLKKIPTFRRKSLGNHQTESGTKIALLRMPSGNYTKRDAKRFMRKKLTAENLVENGTTTQVFAQELLKIGRFAKEESGNLENFFS